MLAYLTLNGQLQDRHTVKVTTRLVCRITSVSQCSNGHLQDRHTVAFTTRLIMYNCNNDYSTFIEQGITVAYLTLSQ